MPQVVYNSILETEEGFKNTLECELLKQSDKLISNIKFGSLLKLNLASFIVKKRLLEVDELCSLKQNYCNLHITNKSKNCGCN
jgi:hypothetical protein